MTPNRWSLPLAVASIAVAAFLAFVRPLEAAIGERALQLEDELRRYDSLNATVRREPAVRRDDQRLASRLAPFRLRVPRPLAVGRFLEAVAGAAQRNGLRLTAVTSDPDVRRSALRRPIPRPTLAPAASTPVANAPTRPAAPSAGPILDAIPLTVTLEGEYGAIIRALRELSRIDIAAEVRVASLTALPRADAKMPLVAAVLRVRVAAEKTDEAAAPVPVF